MSGSGDDDIGFTTNDLMKGFGVDPSSTPSLPIEAPVSMPSPMAQQTADLEVKLFGTMDLSPFSEDIQRGVNLTGDVPEPASVPPADPEAHRAVGLELTGNVPLGLAQLYVVLWRGQRTGTLTLRGIGNNGSTTIIHLANGLAISAEAGKLGTSIGRMLVRLGRITEEQLALAIHQMTERLVHHEAVRLGEVLVGMGLVSSADILETLHLQVQERILDGFEMGACSVEFQPGPVEDVSAFPCPLPRMVYLAMFRAIEDTTVLSMLEPYRELRPVLHAEAVHRLMGELGLGPQEAAAFEDLRRSPSLVRFVQNAASGDPTAIRLAAVLHLFGALTFEAQAPNPALVFAIQKEHARVTRGQPYEVLGLAPTATAQEVEGSLARLKLWGPNELRGAPPEIERMAAEIREAVNRAFAAMMAAAQSRSSPPLFRFPPASLSPEAPTLTIDEASPRKVSSNPIPMSTPVSISPSMIAAESKSSIDPVDEKTRKARAESSFTMGRRTLEKKPAAAIPLFQKAVDLMPSNREYQMYLANAELMAEADERLHLRLAFKAKNATQAVLKEMPNHAKANLFYGKLAKREGNEAEAKKHFSLAAQNDPNDADAKRELRLYETRAEKTKEEKKEKKKKFGIFTIE